MHRSQRDRCLVVALTALLLIIVPTLAQNGTTEVRLAARHTAAPVAGLPQERMLGNPRAAVFVAQLDGANRLSAWEPRALDNATVRSYIQWAPDNQHVVYVSGLTARVQDVTSATDPGREVYRGAAGLRACIWARTRPRVFCGEQKAVVDTEVVAIDVGSLSVERLGSFGGPRYLLHVSPDDGVLSFNKDSPVGKPPGTGGISWVIGTDPASESKLSQTYATWRSEDGQWILDSSTERIMPASGNGPGLALDRNVPPTPGFGPLSIRFTADSQWVIYRGRDAEGKDGLYRTSIGGLKERLGDHPPVAPNARAWLAVSQDGRHFLVAADR
jgi:hypothetical protein